MSDVPRSATRLFPSRYAALVAQSLGLTALVALGLASTGHWDVAGVNRLRDVLGYGHFTLAYLFTWPLVRRQLGSLLAALGYVALFLCVVAGYIALQRVLSVSINFLLLISVFMVHHASNEVLFRQQSQNGYRSFPWTVRRVGWVALVVGLVFVDRLGSEAHPWHGAQHAVALVWTAGWFVYGFRYAWRERMPLILFGWIAGGAVGLWCMVHPTLTLLFTSQFRFGWIIIYHYLAWYVFYTRKLLFRAEGWRAPLPASRRPAAVWRYATTAPIGFLLLVVFGNALIVALCWLGDPLARHVNAATGLSFFGINTMAHILFGVGLPRRSRADSAASDRPAEPLPQFA